MKKIVLLAILLSILSCKTKNDPLAFKLPDFKSISYAKPVLLQTEKPMSYIFDIKIHDSLIFILSDDGKSFIHVFSKENFNFLSSHCKYGRGPGEYEGMADNISIVDDSIYISGTSRPLVRIYSLKNFLNDSLPDRTIRLDGYRGFILSKPIGKCFISCPTIKERYTVHDNSGKLISTNDDYPKYKNISDKASLSNMFGSRSPRAIKPDNTKFVSATFVGGIIEYYNFSNNTITKTNEIRICDPVVNPLNDRMDIFEANTKIGFPSVTATNKYIYAPYIGATSAEVNDNYFAKKIYVFDWNGKPVKSYIIEGNYGASFITVDEKTNRLYYITRDDNGNHSVAFFNL